MPLDLTSVEAKFARAKTHLETYRSELIHWRDGKPYRISPERSVDFTRYYLVLHVEKRPDLLGWTLIIGDCIHNLRCALEHLVYAIAVHESGQNPPPRGNRLAFPIADGPDVFRDDARRIAGLSGPVRAAIESVQPYNRTNPITPPALALLRDFANRDKHKLLELAFANQIEGTINYSLPAGRFGRGKVITNHGKLEDNTPLMTWIFEKPEPGVQFDQVEIGIAISLWHEKRDASAPESAPMNEATALLTFIVDEVRFVIDTVVAAVTL